MKNTIIQFSDDDVKELDFLKFVAGSPSATKILKFCLHETYKIYKNVQEGKK